MRASIEDFNKVQEVAYKYAEAVEKGDPEICKPIFVPYAIVAGYLDDKNNSGPIQILYDVLSEAGAPEGYKARADVVFIDGSVAVARVLEDQWAGRDF
ncbi:hypothetical protein GPJ56_003037 [Histomonas meleagridis]|uniref:uncharacterized protein n=1 Tax=Histomonas meleagridis TaxID=135588 RepID=UPI003559D6E1|nr:hypothetical protein GPJ56_003037 [Histomonas meleagridis]KAH0796693.1 hypothetical protein GO595_010586 [Histomonas meleagridis]